MGYIFYCSVWCDILLFIFILLSLFYIWSYYHYGYWKRKGLFCPKPKMVIGNFSGLFTMEKTFQEIFTELYFKYKSKSHFGIFMMFRPSWVVTDLNIIRTILVKDFAHFTDHPLQVNDEAEPLWGHLFNLRGERWRSLRTKLTPTFTSSKIKYMFSTVADCSKGMMEYLENTELDIINIKEIFSKYTIDIIGSCAFGLEFNSFKDTDAEFHTRGKNIFHMSTIRAMFLACVFFFPNLAQNLKFSILGKDMNDFFYNIVKKTVEYREKNNIIRNDFLQLLIQLKNKGNIDDDLLEKVESLKNDENKLTMTQLVPQVFVFFAAGYETSSSAMSFALYELALNLHVQKILIDEIDSITDKYNGEITYDSLGEMTYLTQVVEETLRKYANLPVLLRICTKDYTIPNTNVVIEKDTPVFIPICAIQMDPEYYPEPEKFDPERFSLENKEKRHHFSYLPFGEGPRICIGNRFGMIQAKLGIATFLSKYEVRPCSETDIPIKFDQRSLVLLSETIMLQKIKRHK